MTVAGNYTQTTNGILSIDLAGATPATSGSGYSQLVVTGNATLAGSLSLALSYTPHAGDSYEAISASGTSGAFNGLPEGSLFALSDDVFSNTYRGGSGADEVISYLNNAVLWTGPSSGDWATAGDWSSGAVPNSSSTVYIPAGDTVTIDTANASINSLSDSGSLVVYAYSLTIASASTIAGTLTLEHAGVLNDSGAIALSSGSTFNWYSGTVEGGGTLTIDSGATATVLYEQTSLFHGQYFDNSHYLDQPLLNYSNSVAFNASTATTANSAASITNENGGTVTLEGTGAIGFTGTAPTFTNDGTIDVTEGSGSVSFALPLVNAGTISVQSGTLAATAAITNQSTVTIAGGATLSDMGAAYTQSSGTTSVAGHLSSNQTVTVSSGTLLGTGTVSANLSNSATVLPGTSASAPGILTVSGNYTQNSSGSLDVDLAGTTAGSGYSQLSVTGNVTLAGSLSPTLNYTPQSGDALNVVEQPSGDSLSGTFSNVAQNSLLVIGTVGFYATYQAASGLTLTAAAHPVITWIGGSSGNWNTASSWQGGTVPNSNDDVIIESGSTVSISSGNASIDALLSVAGTLKVASGASLTVAETSSVSGTLELDGGTLEGAGNLSVSGTFNWNDGTLTGSGGTTIASSGTLNIQDGSVSNPVGRVLDRSLTNAGTVNWNSSRTTSATVNGVLTNQGTLTLVAGGTSTTANTPPTWTNTGTLDANPGTGNSLSIVVPLANQGSGALVVQSGTLATNAAIANSATVTITSGATLSDAGAAYGQTAGTTTVTGTLSSNETVSLTGGTLAGTGTIAANLSNGGTVIPGSASGSVPFAPGVLTVSGNYTQTSNGELSVDLAGTGSSYSQLLVTGTAALAGNLSITLNYTPHAGDTYQIINAPALVGTFNGIPQGGMAVSGQAVFSNSYLGGSGADDVLSYLPNAVVWTGPTSGDWSTAGDWSSGSVPGSSNDVYIPSGDTVNIDTANYSIHSLTVAGALVIDAEELTIASASTVTGSLTLEGAGGTLNDSATMTLTGSGSTFNWYDDTTLTGSGEISIANSATLNVVGTQGRGEYGGGGARTLGEALVNAGYVYFDSSYGTAVTANGVITNEQGGTVTFENTGSMYVPAGTAPTFTNSGTIDVAEGTNSLAFALPLVTSGTLNVQTGTFASTAAITNSGAVSINTGATLSDTGAAYSQSAGTTALAGTATLSSNETVSLTGGTLSGAGTLAASLSNSATVSPGASANAPGILTVSGSYVQSSGGILAIDFAGTTPGSGYSQLAVSGNVALAGTLSGTLNYAPTIGDNLTVLSEGSGSSISGSFSNAPQGGQFVLGVKAFNASYQAGTGLVLTAAVHDVVTWTGATSSDWNTGSNWVGGSVPGPNDDVIILAGGTVVLSSGNQSIDKLTLGGSLQINAGALLAIASNSAASGTLSLAGGTLSDAALLTVNGTLNWSDGTLTGAGALQITSAGTLDVSDVAGTPVGRVLDQSLANSGTVNWSTTQPTTATVNGEITNQSANFNLGGSGGLSSGAAPAFTNSGTITFSDSGSTFALAVPFTNTGTLNIESGTLAAAAAITNSGTVAIGGNATLSDTGAAYTQTGGTTVVGGTLSSDQTVTLTNGLLTGPGVIAASLSNGGTVIPGGAINGVPSAPGILTVTGDYTQTANGILSIDLAGTTTAGVNYSQLVVDGTLSLNGTLTVAVNYTPQTGDNYEPIRQQSSAAVNGTFAGQPEGSLLVGGTDGFYVSYVGGAGNDVVLNFDPNPVITWIGGTTGNWNTPSGWTGGAVPGSNDQVIIPQGSTVTISGGAQSIVSMDVAGALIAGDTSNENNPSLTISSASTVSGTLDLYFVTLEGAGNLTISGLGSALNWYDGTVIGSGELLTGNSATVNVASSGGNSSGGVLGRQWVNSGTVVFGTGGDISATGSGAMTNDGTITADLSSSRTDTLSVPLTDPGAINVVSGTFEISDGGTISGDSTVATGATLALASTTFSFASGAGVSGAGTLSFLSGTPSFASTGTSVSVGSVKISGATVTFGDGYSAGSTTISSGGAYFNAATTIAALTLSGGGLAGSGSVTLTGTSALDGGLLEPANTTVASGAVLNIPTTYYYYSLNQVLGNPLENYGTIVLSGPSAVNIWGPLTNEFGGTIDFDGSGLTGSYSAALINDGTVTASLGIATFALTDVPVTNAGTLTIDSGTTFSVTGAAYQQTAGLTSLLGGTLSSDHLVNIEGGTLVGAGTIQASLASSGTVEPGDPVGLLTVSGNYTQTSAGTLAVQTYGDFAGTDYGQLNVAGAVTLAGGLQVIPQYAPRLGDIYTVIEQQTAIPVAGTFTGISEGGTIEAAGNTFNVSYAGGSAINNVTLTAVPAYSIADVSLPQVPSGIVDYVFTVTLAQPSSVPITLNYATQDMTATAGQDYLAAQGTLTFAPGQTTQTITVHVLGNASPEPSKTFRVVLSNPAQPATTAAYAIGTIVGALGPSNFSSAGTDFWLAIPTNDLTAVPIGDPNECELSVYISSQDGAHGTLTIGADGTVDNWVVGPNGMATITIPGTDQVFATDGVENKGIHIVSDDNPITVYAINHVPYTSDALVALPTQSLGTDYYVLAYGNTGVIAGTRFTVVATADGTILHLTAGPYLKESLPTTVTLNAGQVFQFEDDENPNNSDVTGTRIQSNEPVVVIGGHVDATIPDGIAASDMLMHEMTPVDEWGTNFATVPLATRHADDFRVLASQNGTVVDINGRAVATLNAGQYYETLMSAPSVITANLPVLVAQYSVGQWYDDPNSFSGEYDGGIVGDPFETLVPPTNEFATRYTFGFGYVPNPNNGFYDPGFVEDYVNLTVPNSAVGVIRENGTTLPASDFTPIGTSGYSYAQIPTTNAMSPVVYTFDTAGLNVNFMATAYAFGDFDGYGYEGGYQSAEAASLSLSPSTDTDYVGKQASVTATVLGTNQQPLSGIAVTFVVSGSNPQTTTVYTDASGHATLTYRGTAAGTDVILASVVSNVGFLSATAQKDWVQVSPTIQVNSPNNGSQFTAGTTVLVNGVADPGAHRRPHCRRHREWPTRRGAGRRRRLLYERDRTAGLNHADLRRHRCPRRHGLDHHHAHGRHSGRGHRHRFQSHPGRKLPGHLLPHVFRRADQDALRRSHLAELGTVSAGHAAVSGRPGYQRSIGDLARLCGPSCRRHAVLQPELADGWPRACPGRNDRNHNSRVLQPQPDPLHLHARALERRRLRSLVPIGPHGHNERRGRLHLSNRRDRQPGRHLHLHSGRRAERHDDLQHRTGELDAGGRPTGNLLDHACRHEPIWRRGAAALHPLGLCRAPLCAADVYFDAHRDRERAHSVPVRSDGNRARQQQRHADLHPRERTSRRLHQLVDRRGDVDPERRRAGFATDHARSQRWKRWQCAAIVPRSGAAAVRRCAAGDRRQSDNVHHSNGRSFPASGARRRYRGQSADVLPDRRARRHDHRFVDRPGAMDSPAHCRPGKLYGRSRRRLGRNGHAELHDHRRQHDSRRNQRDRV